MLDLQKYLKAQGLRDRSQEENRPPQTEKHFDLAEAWERFRVLIEDVGDRLTSFLELCFIAILCIGAVAGPILWALTSESYVAALLFFVSIASGIVLIVRDKNSMNWKDACFFTVQALIVITTLAWAFWPVFEVLRLPQCSDTVKVMCRTHS